MIPTSTSDDTLSRTLPMVTIFLIVINVLVLFYMETLAPKMSFMPTPEELNPSAWKVAWEPYMEFIKRYSVVPSRYFSLESGMGDLVLPLFTCMFLHGGLGHLFGNMMYLWVFGIRVEDRMGMVRFLAFYLLCGLVGSFVHIMVSSGSNAPTLGASGAIAGVLGAYIVLYPESEVTLSFWFFYAIRQVRVSALLLLVIWFGLQFLFGTISLLVTSEMEGGVAWWAHIYGFAAGLGLVYLFRRNDGGQQQRPRIGGRKQPDIWDALYKSKGGGERDWS